MQSKFPISLRLSSFLDSSAKSLSISGAQADQLLAIHAIDRIFATKNTVINFATDEMANNYYEYYSKFSKPGIEYLYLPCLQDNPYSSYIPIESILTQQVNCLSKIKDNSGIFLFTSFRALCSAVPPKEFFEYSIQLEKEMTISPGDLAKKLVAIGYTNSPDLSLEGSFHSKGEVFDINPVSAEPFRIYYFDNIIEEIYPINLENNRTDREHEIKSIKCLFSPRIISQNNFVSNFRSNIPVPEPKYKKKFLKRKSILNSLSQGDLFEEYPLFFSHFAKKVNYIQDYINTDRSLLIHINEQDINSEYDTWIDQLRDSYNNSLDIESEQLLPIFSDFTQDFYIFKNTINKHLNINNFSLNYTLEDQNEINEVHLSYSPIKGIITKNKLSLLENTKLINEFINKNFIRNVYYFGENEALHNNFSRIQENDTSLFYSKVNSHLFSGFYSLKDSMIFLSDQDFYKFNTVKNIVSKSAQEDLFANKLSSLKPTDLIVHKQFGVGKFIKITSIDNNESEDFLLVEFDQSDKVYIPLYKLNLIDKYSDYNKDIRLSNLRTNRFKDAKEKARKAAKKLAFDLIKLQANRKQQKAFPFIVPESEYQEFEDKFPYKETIDQQKAINDSLADMQKSTPMDRLICGDVGFGKTEVAIRAAYLAILNGKQVAVLVPTTILALQHYHSFSRRLKEFGVNLNYISRFKSAQETKEIITNIENGKLDLVIGTHKLLSDKIKFKDLGLVIVDEEQRFGVNHKEKLKTLRASVDFMTLTATPIPRTLQLALMDIKQLSIINTPPPRRQSIKTILAKDYDDVIKEAIEREISRGGQVFFVHNRVQDIQLIHEKIMELCPRAKVVVGHGQMSEQTLEKCMSQFYKGEANVLLSTTIIESGIDIPNANTMIINKAHQFGLSQLHQLRGRIGRSERKAFAYLLIPKNIELNEIAKKRLQAIQTYSNLGSGFLIAQSDLDIRGSGDILGAEQSGHLDSIGVELFLELVDEAIREEQGIKELNSSDIEVNFTIPALIPKSYIENPSDRLRYYKKISNTKAKEGLESIQSSLEDSYGILPEEVHALIKIIKIREIVKTLGIESVNSTSSSIILKFNQDFLNQNKELQEKVIKTMMSRREASFTPDQKIMIKQSNELDLENIDSIYQYFKMIDQQITAC